MSLLINSATVIESGISAQVIINEINVYLLPAWMKTYLEGEEPMKEDETPFLLPIVECNGCIKREAKIYPAQLLIDCLLDILPSMT